MNTPYDLRRRTLAVCFESANGADALHYMKALKALNKNEVNLREIPRQQLKKRRSAYEQTYLQLESDADKEFFYHWFVALIETLGKRDKVCFFYNFNN